MANQSTSPAWLDRPVLKDPSKLFSIENLLIALIIILAILSRFVMLGERVMSHDEVNHVVPSNSLYTGKGYVHDPVTHGPFQFHIVALTYFLFGDNDFTSRVPAATFSVAAIIFLIFAFRRYLGRSGALAAGFFFLISPYMLYYGRYTRNEGFIELIGVVLLYGILRYLEKGDRVGMFLVTLATLMHFIVKETAFIYTAQALIFLFVMFLIEARRADIRSPRGYNRFLLYMGLAMLLVLVALGLGIMKADTAKTATETATAAATVTATPTAGTLSAAGRLRLYAEVVVVLGAAVLGLLGLFTLARDIGWGQIKRLRSFSLLVIIITLILPMLSPLPISMVGWNPLDYHTTTGMLRTGLFVTLFFTIGAAIGVWWNPIVWLQNALVFWTLFTVFYTTFFTNGGGFFTGVVGSLGYWSVQQGVERGSQPRYYYALIQMPIYEYLAVLGTLLAAYFGLRYRRFITLPGYSPAFSPRVKLVEDPVSDQEARSPQPGAENPLPAVSQDDEIPVTGFITNPDGDVERWNDITGPDAIAVTQAEREDAKSAVFYSTERPLPVLALLIYWAITSLVAYSLAGERMPWLTVHVTLGFLLAAAWGIGYLVDTTDWKRVTRLDGLLALLLVPVFFVGLASMAGSLLGARPPFQGKTLEQLQATSTFFFSLLAGLGGMAGILYLLRDWELRQVARLATVVFFGLAAVLTARTAYQASFINYDYANEYLVYAHAAPGPKQALKQIEEISNRIAGGKSLNLAYGGDIQYPFWWYMREYPNHRWFQGNPTRDLRDNPVIVVGDDLFDKMTPIVSDEFVQYDFMRLWWPNQDYFYLTWERVWNAIKDPRMRSAIFDIWLNRDFREYAALSADPAKYTFESWSPAARMRMYIRKDIVAQIWNYGASPAALTPEQTDPYKEKLVQLAPVQVIGSAGSQPGQFNAPRGIRVAADGSLYVADSRNNRIQHLAADGAILQTWGTKGDINDNTAVDGTFNEPWDVAVGQDGSVYVSDTWNHRIQKFTADGQFVKKWGYFGQGEAPDAFWGPRGLAIDSQGRLYVMDTGNKRVVIFDPDGNFINQFGAAGFGEGEFDEPVGITVDAQDNIYITDTWNQRIQVFQASADLKFVTPQRMWDIAGWKGQSLDNKPFLAVSPVSGNVFVADPERPRVLEFDPEGNYVRGWGDFSTGPDGFGIVSGIAFTPDGQVWIADGGNNVLLKFEVPE